MITIRNSFYKFIGLVGLSMLPVLAHGSMMTYEVNVDTESIVGMPGYLDFQFTAGNGSHVDPAMITLFDFTSDGTVTPLFFPNIGDVSSPGLPNTVVMDNAVPSEYTPSFTFGDEFQILVTLNVNVSGTATYGDTFMLSAFDSNYHPLLTNTGSLLDLAIAPGNGAVSIVSSFDNDADIVQAPEPSSFPLLALGFVGAIAAYYRNGRTARR